MFLRLKRTSETVWEKGQCVRWSSDEERAGTTRRKKGNDSE